MTQLRKRSAKQLCAASAIFFCFVGRATGKEAAPHPLSLVNVRGTQRKLDANATLSVLPTQLWSSGSFVEVSWSGTGLGSDAYVAAYSPGSVLSDDEKLRATVPVKYQLLDYPSEAEGGGNSSLRGSSGGEAATLGSVRFALLNLRDGSDGYRFGLFTGGLQEPVLVAVTSDMVTFARVTEPTQVHLSLTGDPTEMRVSWVSGGNSASPSVKFWPIKPPPVDPDDESPPTLKARVAVGYHKTYDHRDMCDAPATGVGYHPPGNMNTAVMTGLVPGWHYFYEVGDPDADVWTTPVAFSAAPPGKASGKVPGLVRLAVFGDLGTAELDGSFNVGHEMEPPALQTTAMLQRYIARPEFLGSSAGGQSSIGVGLVLHIGDICYARGYASQWDEFMAQIEPSASTVPWMVAAGNHERDSPKTSESSARPQLAHYRGTDSGGECGVPYAFRFPMPPPSHDPLADTPWYSFDYGPVHFTVIGTEHDLEAGSPQHTWLAEDLASVNRSGTPWLVLAGHRPMYVDSQGGGTDECTDPRDPIGPYCGNDQPVARYLRESIETLMVEHKVDMALWGHHHSYQRTCMVVNNTCRGVSEPLFATADDHSDGNQSLGTGAAIGAVFAPRDTYEGPVHLVVGMAGKELSQNLHFPRLPPFEYANDQEYGLAILEANATALGLRFVLDVDGSVDDEVWLMREDSTSPQISPLLEKALLAALEVVRAPTV